MRSTYTQPFERRLSLESTTLSSSSWLGIIGSTALMLLTYLARQYLIPFLQVGKRQKYAQYIAVVADDIIDELRLKYPDRTWLEHLDEAITTLVLVCGITPDIAERAINASSARK